MIKYKNLCGYNLSMETKNNLTMETKDHLTIDEVREAIKILTLRKDNLDGFLFSTIEILVALASVEILMISSLNTGFSFFVFVLVILDLVIVGISILISCWARKIDKKANKLAKDYKLEKFLDAISYEKLSCVNGQDKEQKNKKLHDYK